MPPPSNNSLQQPLPASAHFIGVGGIGMSAVAAAFAWMGTKVTGSDRKLAEKGDRDDIFDSLEQAGIRLFPQDGSFVDFHCPDVLVASTAVEPDNPDIAAAQGVPLLHRSEALNAFLAACWDKTTIAVCGTSGKTTTTAWLAETLHLMGEDPILIGGGISNRFADYPGAIGNFKPGNGGFIVFEADESDKTLDSYAPDAALLLNAGTDHHPEKELLEIFEKFLASAKTNVLEAELAGRLHGSNPAVVFDAGNQGAPDAPHASALWKLQKYEAGQATFERTTPTLQTIRVDASIPLPGRHSAVNAMAALAMLDALEIDFREAAETLPLFKGVRRRFDIHGATSSGALVIDDYAHNPDKIAACLAAVREAIPEQGRIIAIFQPHGFKPLEFMREALFHALETALTPKDTFAFLPVYYAGGTTSFSPSSREVAGDFADRSHNGCEYLALEERPDAERLAEENARAHDAIVIMGARDESLSKLAERLAACKITHAP